jgi:hypothetical protein
MSYFCEIIEEREFITQVSPPSVITSLNLNEFLEISLSQLTKRTVSLHFLNPFN